MNKFLDNRLLALLCCHEASYLLPEELRIFVIKDDIGGVFRDYSFDLEFSVGLTDKLNGGKDFNFFCDFDFISIFVLFF